MSRGWNKWEGGGNVTAKIDFGQKPDGTPVGTFVMACDRDVRDGVVTAFVKVNMYGRLVDFCRPRLVKGQFVRVEGELMNRDGRTGELLEVRARDIVFLKLEMPEGVDHGS
jgi:single-stranded DNA-binding protein